MYLAKRFFIFLFFLKCSSVIGQIDTSGMNSNPVGPWTIGGNVRFSSTNFNQLFPFSFLSNVEKSNYFSINPVLTYGLKNNRTSLNLLLGYTTGSQSGSSLVNVSDPIGFILRPTNDNLNGFSFGASVDHYFILTRILGIRLELGTNFQTFKSTRIQEQVVLNGDTFPQSEMSITDNSIEFFLGPNIDVFLHQRINLIFNMGNIAYVINSLGNNTNGTESTNQFFANFSPDNIGFGIDFNF